jgi:hypothetical protein
MVFKSVRNFLSGSGATWVFSGRAHRVTQDHPVYIPRDLNCSVSCRQRRVQLQVLLASRYGVGSGLLGLAY